MLNASDILFELIQVSLGIKETISEPLTVIEWDSVYLLAEKQSLLGFCYEALHKLSDMSDCCYGTIGMSSQTYYNWTCAAVATQILNEKQLSLIHRLAMLYESTGLHMMLLKGYGLSRLYPNPTMRKPGDIDIYLFADYQSYEPAWKRGDIAVANKWGITVKYDSEHHTKFNLEGIEVENHYDFINTRIRRSSQMLEKEFKSLSSVHDNWIDVEGAKVYLPSDKFNLLFLLRHTAAHFASEGVTLKNVLDWGLFVSTAKSIDWGWLWQIAKVYNLHNFLGCLNAICVENLGFEISKFQQESFDKSLKTKVLNEIMKGPDLVANANVFQRVSRWWIHRWKHKICYSDSLISSFIYSVKAGLSAVSIK